MSGSGVSRFALFRADASAAIGGGHVQRCLALAETFSELGWRCGFACRAGTVETVPALKSAYDVFTLHGAVADEAAELGGLVASQSCDLLIVDHYGRDHAFESACRSFAKRIMALDDQPNRAHDCDVLLDATPGRTAADYIRSVPPGCELLLGAEYALLRRQFVLQRPAALKRRQGQRPVARVLISFGTTDPQNLTEVALRGIAESGLPLAADIVLGSAAPHLKAVTQLVKTLDIDARLHVDVADMAQLMSDADVAIGACGGSSSFERCCLGLPSLVVLAAENQRHYAAALIAAGSVDSLSDGNKLRAADIAMASRKLAADAERRATMGRKAAALCDGRGPLRVAIGLLAPEITRDRAKVTLRLAQTGDRDLILTWQQFPGSRRFAHNPQPPTAAEHTQWFAGTLDDPSRMLFIVQFEGKPAGMLRLDRESLNQFKISILTAPERYRRGIGAAALALARRLLVRAELHAEVLPANEASRALFCNAGYREQNAGLFVNSYSEAMVST